MTHNIGSKQDYRWLKCYNIIVERMRIHSSNGDNMYNYFMIIGRVKAFQSKELGEQEKMFTVQVETQDHFKDRNGNYPTNVLEIQLNDYLATVVQDNVEINSVIFVKGRIATKNLISNDNSNSVILIAERVLRLANK